MKDRSKIIPSLSLLGFSIFMFAASFFETYTNGKFSDYASAAANIAMALAAWVALTTWKKQLDYSQKIKVAEDVDKAAQNFIWALADARSDVDVVVQEITTQKHIDEDIKMFEKFTQTRESYMQLSSLAFSAERWLGREVAESIEKLLDRWAEVGFAHNKLKVTKMRLRAPPYASKIDQEKLNCELVEYREITRGGYGRFSSKIDLDFSDLQSAMHRSIKDYK